MGGCHANVGCQESEIIVDEHDLAAYEPLSVDFPVDQPIPRKRVDFERQGLVPDGWRKTDLVVPAGFLLVGGDACIIEPEESEERDDTRNGTGSEESVESAELAEADSAGPGHNLAVDVARAQSCVAGAARLACGRAPRVLLALPDWAVDVARAQWLTRLPPGAEWQALTRLWHVNPVPAAGLVTFIFDLPPSAHSLQTRVRDDSFTDAMASRLHSDLLRLLLCLPTLKFWGLLRPELVHVDEQGSLLSVVPLGCLLNFKGARAAIHGAPAVAPELTRAMAHSDSSLGASRGRCLGIDAHGVAALVLGALGAAGKGVAGLSDGARDLLEKSLRHDPESRIGAGAALCHPWLASRESDQESARLSCISRSSSLSCRRGMLGGQF